MNVLAEQQASETQIKVLYQQLAELHDKVKAEQEKLKKLPTKGKSVRSAFFRGVGTVVEVEGQYIKVKFNDVTPITVKLRATWVTVVEETAMKPMQPRQLWQSPTRRERMVQPASALVVIPAATFEQAVLRRTQNEIAMKNRELVEAVGLR